MDDAADIGAARAFEALRAEVAALRQAMAEPVTPDYAPTLGAIAKGLEAVEARLGAIEAAPQLRTRPADVARQIRQEAVELAKSQIDQARAAQRDFEQGEETLADMASVMRQAQRDRRVVWGVGSGAALLGAILGTALFLEINRHAPDGWGWSADWAAWLMQADPEQAGYRLIGNDDPALAAVLVGADKWRAGEALMGRASPKAYEKMVRLYSACGERPVEACEAALTPQSVTGPNGLRAKAGR